MLRKFIISAIIAMSFAWHTGLETQKVHAQDTQQYEGQSTAPDINVFGMLKRINPVLIIVFFILLSMFICSVATSFKLLITIFSSNRHFLKNQLDRIAKVRRGKFARHS